MIGDLTSLANVNAWLGLTTTTDAAVLQRLITQCSRSILDYLQRPSLISQTYTDVSDGTGGTHEFLDNWPVTSVTQVAVGAEIIPPAPIVVGSAEFSGAAGWRLQGWDGYTPGGPQAVELVGRVFRRGRLNVAITYQAGYMVPAEALTITSTSYEASQLLGPWAADSGVTYADGTVLTPVAGAPGQGQYAVSGGGYTFSAADIGQAITISYSYTPATLEDACINWVSERYRYRGRLGERSRSIGGQTTASYDLSAIPGYVESALQAYKKVLPV